MINALNRDMDRLTSLVRETAEMSRKAAEVVQEHVVECNKRDVRVARTTGEIDAKLNALDIHRQYMDLSQKRNEKFNWALITGVGGILALVLVDFITKHIH